MQVGMSNFLVLHPNLNLLRWAGPDLGAHNDEIRRGRLQMTSDEIDVLRTQDIIGSRA